MKKQYVIIGVVGILLILYFYVIILPKYGPLPKISPICKEQTILNKTKILENIILSLQNNLPKDVIEYLNSSIDLSQKLCKEGKLSQARSIL
jgi:hypothetical protein